jgi:hypothetical protein
MDRKIGDQPDCSTAGCTHEHCDRLSYDVIVVPAVDASVMELEINLISPRPYAGIPDAKATTTVDDNGTSVTENMVLESTLSISGGIGPWLRRWIFREMLGPPHVEPGSKVHIEINATTRESAAASPRACPPIIIDLVVGSGDKTIKDPPLAPRLMACLNTTPVRQTSANGTPNWATIETILVHIWSRLTSDMNAAWLGPQGRGDFGLLDLSTLEDEVPIAPNPPPGASTTTAAALTEEKWARMFSEMITGTAYRSFESAYSHGKDKKYYDRLVDPTGKSYPLTACCQHLNSLVQVTRGAPKNSMYGDCGAETAYLFVKSCWLEGHGKWHQNQQDVNTFIGDKQKTGVTNGSEPNLLPGTYFLFDHSTGAKVNGDHVTAVVRVRRSAAGSYVQTFDTGAANIPKRSENTVPGCAGQYEDPWSRGSPPGPPWFSGGNKSNFFYGTGVENSGFGDLESIVSAMRSAVPLGMARLVLLDQASNTVLYATPLLDMRPDTAIRTGFSSPDSFSISRFAWSLRELPGRQAIRAVWLIDIPRRNLAKAFVEATDLWQTSIATLATDRSQIANDDGNQDRFRLLDISTAIVAPAPATTLPAGGEISFEVHSMEATSPRPVPFNALPVDQATVAASLGAPPGGLAAYLDAQHPDRDGNMWPLAYFKGKWS